MQTSRPAAHLRRAELDARARASVPAHAAPNTASGISTRAELTVGRDHIDRAELSAVDVAEAPADRPIAITMAPLGMVSSRHSL